MGISRFSFAILIIESWMMYEKWSRNANTTMNYFLHFFAYYSLVTDYK